MNSVSRRCNRALRLWSMDAEVMEGRNLVSILSFAIQPLSSGSHERLASVEVAAAHQPAHGYFQSASRIPDLSKSKNANVNAIGRQKLLLNAGGESFTSRGLVARLVTVLHSTNGLRSVDSSSRGTDRLVNDVVVHDTIPQPDGQRLTSAGGGSSTTGAEGKVRLLAQSPPRAQAPDSPPSTTVSVIVGSVPHPDSGGSTTAGGSSMTGDERGIRPLALSPSRTQAIHNPSNSTFSVVGGRNTSDDVSGGSGPVPVLTDQTNGPDFIGGPAKISVAPPSDSSLTITNVDWNSASIVDNLNPPSVADGTFEYPTSIVNDNHSTTLQGYWGPSGGSEQTITADVTYSDNSSNENSIVIPTYSGQITGTFTTLGSTSTTYTAPTLKYASGNKPGISWSFTSDYGTVQVVQILTGGYESENSDPNSPPIQGYRSLATKNSDGSFVDAPFPLVDVAGDNPFYASSYDNPYMPLLTNMTYATMTLDFTDYVMFRPFGGIWVPHSIFTWSIDSTASLTNGQWIGQDVSPPGIDDEMTYDSSLTIPTWNDKSGNYNQLIPM